MSDTRLVPMTREQRDWLALLLPGMSFNEHIPGGLIGAWDAAPADPAEAVRTSVELFGGVWISDKMADAVLVALGYPDGSPRQGNPT